MWYVRSCIHRLFPCGVCPWCLVTCYTDNESLFCLQWVQRMDMAIQQNKGSFSVWCVTREQGHTPQVNSVWIQGLKAKEYLNSYVLHKSIQSYKISKYFKTLSYKKRKRINWIKVPVNQNSVLSYVLLKVNSAYTCTMYVQVHFMPYVSIHSIFSCIEINFFGTWRESQFSKLNVIIEYCE